MTDAELSYLRARAHSYARLLGVLRAVAAAQVVALVALGCAWAAWLLAGRP